MASLEEQLLQVTGADKVRKNRSWDSDSDEEGQLSSDVSSDNERDKMPRGPLKKRLKENPVEDDASKSEDFEDGFDDDLLGDRQDRQYMNGLSETQREEILSERYKKRQELQERKAVHKQKKKSEKNNSRKTRSDTAANKYQSPAKSDRAKSLADLAKKRAKKSNHKSWHEYSSEESEDESDDSNDYEDSYQKLSQPDSEEEEADEPQLTFGQIQPIFATRNNLKSWLGESFFSQVVKGLIVRIGIGENNQNEPVYVMAEVDDIVSSTKSYSVDGQQTDKSLHCKIGEKYRDSKISFISNKPLLEREIKNYLVFCKNAGADVLTEQEINKRAQRKHAIITKIKTHDDVVQEIKEQQEKGKINIGSAARKTQLIAERDAMVLDDDDEEKYDKYLEICGELEELEKQEQERANTGSQQAKNLKSINQRHKESNHASSHARAQANSEPVNHDNPFARRRTQQQTIIYSASDKTGETSLPDPKVEETAVTVQPARESKQEKEQRLLKQSLENVKSSNVEIEINPEQNLSNRHDIDIDIDIDNPETSQELKPVSISLPSTSIEPPPAEATRHSLQDYLKARGK